MHLIRSAVLKMTLYYLLIIMALSIGFSLFLYHVSSIELNRELRRPSFITQTEIGTLFNYDRFRDTRLEESHHHLLDNLIAFNIATLFIGGALSYALALRTLHPIEDALEAQSRFTADASHELRTPLTAMQTEIEVALRNPKLNAEAARQLLASNLEEVGKLKALSDSLLHLAQQNGQSDSYRTISLKEVAAQAAEYHGKQAQAKDITIENRVPAMTVQGDKETLVQAVAILLDNAVKYSGPKTTVVLSGKRLNHQVELSVKDHGSGIKASDLPHIFDRFYRADRSRNKETVDGYGLGLSIAKKIVELHHGSITVKSTLEQGSTFTIKLPLETA